MGQGNMKQAQGADNINHHKDGYNAVPKQRNCLALRTGASGIGMRDSYLLNSIVSIQFAP
jgi:hypothetical protein